MQLKYLHPGHHTETGSFTRYKTKNIPTNIPINKRPPNALIMNPVLLLQFDVNLHLPVVTSIVRKLGTINIPKNIPDTKPPR